MELEYKFYNDEQTIISKINSLEDIMKDLLQGNSEEQELCYEDLFLLAAVDKSQKLIDSFLFALERRNITVLAILTRVQMDSSLRSYASTLVADSTDFCKKVLFEGKQVDRLKSVNGTKLTDHFLCESLGEELKLPIYELYKKICGFVHFSASSFYNTVHIESSNSFVMKISKENQEEHKETYQRLSIELANHFYYFGKILVDWILRSWWEQKEQMYRRRV